jgi:hypothetical protein
MASVEALIEAEEISYRCHIDGPLDNWSLYEVLTDGLIAAKAEHRAALARHDHALADKLMLEIIDLTMLAAAAADGLALQRARWLASDAPWPLTPA